MRKGDLELLEMRLAPHAASIDRLTTDTGELVRSVAELTGRMKDLERNTEAHKTDIAQGLASIRSLLQRANRAARDVGIVGADGLDLPVDPVHVGAPTRDEVIRAARAKHSGRALL